MSRVPTPRELEVLRYLAVGMRIGPSTHPRTTHPVVAKGVTVITIQHRTIEGLQAAGWISGDSWTITPAGRAIADCKTFVRAFAEGISR